MLKMRLQRTGRKHDPSFRVIVQEHTRGPRAGKHVDLIGNYDVKKGNVKLNAEKVKLWLSRGVKPSGTVWNLLVSEGIVKGKKVNVLPKKTVPEKKEEGKAEAQPAETEATLPEEKGEGTNDEKTEREGDPAPQEEIKETEDIPEEPEAPVEKREVQEKEDDPVREPAGEEDQKK